MTTGCERALHGLSYDGSASDTNQASKPRRIRVVHLATNLQSGGASETAIGICALLPSNEFEVTLLAGTLTEDEASRGADLVAHARSLGIDVRMVPNLHRPVSVPEDLRTLMALQRWFRRSRPDVVHTHKSKSGALGRLAAKAAGVPAIVHTVHGWSFHVGQGQVTQRALQFLERYLAKVSSALVVVTEEDRRAGLNARVGHEDQYVLIRSGIELTEFHPDPRRREAVRAALAIHDGDTVVGTVGRLEPQKDPLLFVRTAAAVSRSLPTARFLMVGEGSLRHDVVSLARRSGIGDKLTMLGDRRDVADLMRAFDVMLMTSRWEGLPRVVIEAMATRVPVVSTAVGGVREVIQDGCTGLLASPDDLAGLARNVVRVATSPDRGGSIAEAASKLVIQFSQETMVANTAALYRARLPGGITKR